MTARSVGLVPPGSSALARAASSCCERRFIAASAFCWARASPCAVKLLPRKLHVFAAPPSLTGYAPVASDSNCACCSSSLGAFGSGSGSSAIASQSAGVHASAPTATSPGACTGRLYPFGTRTNLLVASRRHDQSARCATCSAVTTSLTSAGLHSVRSSSSSAPPPSPPSPPPCAPPPSSPCLLLLLRSRFPCAPPPSPPPSPPPFSAFSFLSFSSSRNGSPAGLPSASKPGIGACLITSAHSARRAAGLVHSPIL